MVCGRCGKNFDEKKQDYCGYCRTVHTADGKPIRDAKGILCYITKKFGKDVLLNPRRTDALIADLFPKESAARRLCFVALYDGCARRLGAVAEKPFEMRAAAASRCVKSLRDEIGLKGSAASEIVEAVGCAVGCEISFKRSGSLSASETESKKNVTDPAEQYSLGRHFDRVHEYNKALYWFEKAALQDYGEAQFYMGRYTMDGLGGAKQDTNQSREWFVRGMENGVAEAEYMVGYFYAEGVAGVIDEKKAFECFLGAAKKGCENAINTVALCYENGVYVKADREQAERWRNYKVTRNIQDIELPEIEPPEPAHDDGEEFYRQARLRLASKDFEGSAKLYKKAAEAGHIRAMCSYGKCLYTGSGTVKDPAEAFRWFSRAADLGSPIGQYNLGVMYLKGVFVRKDISTAKDYFKKAADNGHEDSAKILKKMN